VTTGDGSGLPFNADGLRSKYREERDKRLRPDGNGQYIRIEGNYAQLQRDPYTPIRPRDPLCDDVEVLIVGGGFSGLMMAARLKVAGVADVRVVERGGDFGGTWYWNRYPGAQCDIESYIYLPLLEEVGTVPRQKYSNAPEIFAHCRAVATRYGLYEDACFHTLVTELRWDETRFRWLVSTDRGDRMRARFICLADGPLSQPKLPGIPGIANFQGAMFHTSRWDYAYTGGDANGGLTGLRGKRVGVIGTGATAIQCVPYLAQDAGHLYVFQRTPSAVFPRDNKQTDPAWAAALKSGWQRMRMKNFNRIVSGADEEDQVADGLTRLTRNLSQLPKQFSQAGVSAEEIERAMEMLDFEEMERLRARVEDIVSDPVTAAALKPWYRAFCKRPCFSDDYLQAFNRANVTLADTQGQGVSKFTETAAVVGGRAYELDCVIFATGFEVGTSYPRRSGFELFGSGTQTLTGKWSGGLRTVHGLLTSGFPNCFFLGISQGAYTANFTHMLYEQSDHVAHLIDLVRRSNAQAVEATEEGEARWVDAMNGFGGSLGYFRECTPGYYNNEGQVAEGRTPAIYGGGAEAFFKILADWRRDEKMAGVRLIG
jgi:cyclohexanone monooxygenase